MNKPATLFDRPREILVTDSNARDEDDERLAGQNLEIYNLMLEHAVVSNKQLSSIALKYTSRISDIRRWLERRGQTIRCTYGEGGVNYYSIVTKG